MTIKNEPIRKKKPNVTLELTGSQINLSPRPLPVTHLVWSSNYRTYPMRRAVSALGFQQKNAIRSNTNSRPQSADNIRSCAKNFKDRFSNSDDVRAFDPDHFDFDEPYQLSDNVFDNIINDYSEIKFVSSSPGIKIDKSAIVDHNSDLKPGLSSKPPLPPQNNNDLKSPSRPKANHAVENPNHAGTTVDGNVRSEEEAFDEIIALKFQRWFPNSTASTAHKSSPFDSIDDIDDVRLLSYKKQCQTTTSCEYRCEISKKNQQVSTVGYHKRKNYSTSKEGNRLAIGKKSDLKSSMKNDSVRDDEKTIESTLIAENETGTTNLVENNDSYRYENVPEVFETNDDEVLRLLEERDLKILRERRSSRTEKILEEDDVESVKSTNDQKCGRNTEKRPKSVTSKCTLQRKGNSVSSPLKKQRKIKFSIDKRGIDGETKKCVDGKRRNSGCSADSKNLVNSISETTANEASEKIDSVGISRDQAFSPQEVANSQIEDVVSWMGAHRSTTPHSKMTTPEGEPNHSMYEEIVDILKDIEREEIHDQSKSVDTSPRELPPSTSSAKAIWSLLEEAEKNLNQNDVDVVQKKDKPQESITHSSSKSSNNVENKSWNRLSDLLRFSNAELAEKVMALQLLLEERESAWQSLHSRYKNNEQLFQQKKQEFDQTISKRQRLIEQLQQEKKTLIEKLENSLRDVEKKHESSIQALDDKYKIELKKALEKQANVDKIERDRWKETETKRIQERAIKGFQPELNRKEESHAEEISDMHKFYKKQLVDLEETYNRRMNVQKEKFEAEKEKALAIEREIWRQKLEDEISELEKRYQDQRKRLLAEVHVERETMERANDATLAIKEKENERKWQSKSLEMQKKIESLQIQHQEELQKLHQHLESEKQLWIKNQMMEFMEKENRTAEQCKKDRDKHIELVIQKLENENTKREQVCEQKIKRLKEQHEIELNDVEMANENLRRKLNESRSEMQKHEELVSQLRAQCNQLQTECVILKEKYDRLQQEQGEYQNIAKSELSTKYHILQNELTQAQLTFESQIKLQQSEHKRELNEMYNKFKEIFLKKDEAIEALKKQKQVALSQCNQMEKLLDLKRKELNGHFRESSG